ncbi:TonB-dependent receptor [Simiduia curdlanivorans]|uniref:TonB-dependent receptor n=1 Tax=Simiduia curdlanivorans TaxID=1492769 RepID=A0ABV8V6P7_9GAMM|nr:TonB-dependent receptor [Simiduia curdlanivorans]MDN3640582.1 TonB-dependent receptor [Simiduia curdlanivorans]
MFTLTARARLIPSLALLSSLQATHALAVEQVSILETITVTATREEVRLADTAASVGILTEQALAEINPMHSADALNRIAGVNVVQLGSGGSGVAAAIRQPVSYNPVYLYLENGVPTRSPGFFNHNALYEVNVSQADSVEVFKGPGSALYGSDAIGGLVNVITGRAATESYAKLNAEGGEHGWKRAQLKGAHVGDDHSISGALAVTDSDGWREHTAYQRTDANLNWNTIVGSFDVVTLFTGSELENESGGAGLLRQDYLNNPEKAGNLIGYRDVSAYRLTSQWHAELGDGEITLTPFARQNDLEYIATWTLNTGREVCKPWQSPNCQLDSQDAHINQNGHSSVGIQVKYKRDISAINGLMVTGLDTDLSRGDTTQTYITRTDSDPGSYWLSYQKEQDIYDYRVDFSALAPYLHIESQITQSLRISAGLRYDQIDYDYHTELSPNDAQGSIHKRPEDTQLSYNHTSPKLGLTWQINDRYNSYMAYRHAFRIPTEGQLFRSGATVDSTALAPVKADSFEIGLRGTPAEWLNIDTSIYHMILQDEIISLTDNSTGARYYSNAGKTQHQGLELALSASLEENWQTGFAYTYALHTYVDWQDGSNDYSGLEQPNAPKHIGNLWLQYRPNWLNGGRIEAEWRHQSPSFIDEANTLSYEGHDLFNLRGSFNLSDELQLYANLLNATDARFAESVAKWGPTYTPGRPRTLIAGINYSF